MPGRILSSLRLQIDLIYPFARSESPKDSPAPGARHTAVRPARHPSRKSTMIQGLNVVEVQDCPPLDDEDRLALLGSFEQAIVLATLACGPEATAGAIKARLTPLIGERHINGVLTTLERLAKKGIIDVIGKAARAGLKGRRCKTYQVTPEGFETVERGVTIVAGLARDAGLRRAA
jgi:hypothetical protein